MNDSALIKHIVLVGHALPLAMSSAILSSQLAGYGVKITAVELADSECTNLECTGNEFMALCGILNIPIKQVLTTCQASFSLGHRYQKNSDQWFVPYGHYGLKTLDCEFMQGVFRLQHQYPDLAIDSVCIAAQASRQNKFAIPPVNRPDLQDALAFSVNLDAKQYGEQLARYASQYGVSFIRANNIEVERNSMQQISAVILDNTERLAADFWIDCSGQMAVLASSRRAIKDAGHVNAANRIVECWTECQDSPQQPYDGFKHCPWGWLKVSSMPERIHYQLEYDSRQVTQTQVKQWLTKTLPSLPKQIKHRENIASVLVNAWQANCLTVGDAAVNFGKQIYSELFFVQAALIQFLDLYPLISNQDISAQKFNRNWQQFVDEAAEYVQCHCWLGQRSATDEQIPDDALYRKRLELFLRFGRMPPAESDAVNQQRWYGLLAGFGMVPELSSLYLTNLSNQQLEESLKQVTRSIDRLVAGMPIYQDFYHQFCQAQSG